jgi:hypothetical protein
VVEDLVARPGLHDAALLHHGDPVAQVTHDSEIVGDDEVAHAAFLLELEEEVEDLSLDRDVQGGHGLVADDELGLQRQGPGDADALQLAAREGARSAVAQSRVDAHPLQERTSPPAALGSVVEAMDGPGLGHDVADREAWVDRGVGVLVDELDVPPHAAQLGPLQAEQVLPAEGDAAGVGCDEPQQDPCQCRLARPRLTHQPVCLASFDSEIHVAHGLDLTPSAATTRREGLAETSSIEQRISHRLSVPTSGTCGASAAAPTIGVVQGSSRQAQREQPMPTDFEISLSHRPGSLAAASGALGKAGINIEGGCAYVCEGHGVYHVLVSDAERARRALIDAGFDILNERRVILSPVEDRPGAASALLSRVAEHGVSIDLVYLTAEGKLVLGGDDLASIQRALD